MFVGVGPFTLNNCALAHFISSWAWPNCCEKPNASLLSIYYVLCLYLKKIAMAPKYDKYYTNLEIRAFEVYGEISIIEQRYKEMRFGYKEMKSFSMYKVTRHKPTTTNLLWIVFFLIYKNKIYLKLKIKRLEANFSPFLKMSYPKQILAKKQQHLNFKQEATQLLYVGPISVWLTSCFWKQLRWNLEVEFYLNKNLKIMRIQF